MPSRDSSGKAAFSPHATGFLALLQILAAVQEVYVLVDRIQQLEDRLSNLETSLKPAPDPQVLDTKAAAKLLGLSPRTLETWRSRGKGPPYVSGRPVQYRRGDLEAWQKRRIVRS